MPHLWPTGSSWDSSLDYGPVLLRKPFGFHLAVDTLPSGASRAAAPGPPWQSPAFAFVPFRLLHTFCSLRPARRYPRLWIRRSSPERRRDFNPPDPCAARRTLRSAPTPCRPSGRTSLPSLGRTCRRPGIGAETSGSPRFLGIPRYARPALRPRRVETLLAQTGVSHGRRCQITRRLPQQSGSRGSITRPMHSLSTLRGAGHPYATQDSLPAGG